MTEDRGRPIDVSPPPKHRRGKLPEGQPLNQALAELAGAPLPDGEFGADMRAVRDAVGS